MKKILLMIILGLSLFSCVDKNGEVKKESIKNEATDKNNIKSITYKDLNNNENFKKILDKNILKVFETKDEAKKIANDILKELKVVYDEFNKENKITSINEKADDKIKLELFEFYPNDEDFINVDSMYIRGNITFNFVGNDYFRFDKIILLTDKNRYEVRGDVFAQDSKYRNGKTYQFVKYNLDADKYAMLLDIVKSEKVRIRFAKNDSNKDFTLSKKEIDNLRVLEKYINLVNIYRIAVEEFFNRAN